MRTALLALPLVLLALPVRAVHAQTPPAEHLTARLDDQGNGRGRIAWLDAEGRVYDLGPEVPLPSAAGPPAGSSPEALVRAAAARRGVSPDYLVRVGRCESGLDPKSSGRYLGMFQFSQTTWNWMSAQAGEGGNSPFDARAAAETAAWAFSQGYASHWPRCRYA